ncbi:DUF1206 domain-containing protein [Sphingosinithalassobacter sp. LHW66-3]|uniref:DUF1206 domain-containing protein n=1 Tax=Sphingosinithalassobacter sp. LHW66-3 TaxID=3424718 RepID=UPI003D6B0190
MERVARLETFARIGYLARAIVYFLIGYITLATGQSEGTASILEDIQDLPAGTVLLAFTALGLFGYGVFRLYGAAIDIQGEGDDAKGIGKRIGHAASGIAHLILAFLAAKIAFSDGGGGSGSGSTSSEAAQTVLALPGGTAVLVLVGIGFLLGGVNQGVKAATGKFMRLLDADAPGWTEWIGRIGYAARAAVFVALGWQILQSAFGGDTGDLSFEAALQSMREIGWLYTAVAVGLLVFGIFSLVMARYRRIRNENVIERVKNKAVPLL